ncbi:type II secretion system F family protein [Intrasporangium sp.]|uniref:type II secretion system F family protein n=1 Tax=Intrasporangium sp. TaxID=1925024 RepID=UPI0032215AE9
MQSTQQQVTGVLTFRTASAQDVDPNRLRASIGKQPVTMRVERVSHEDRAAMLVIDTSGSMGRSGMATVRSATAAYLEQVPSDVKVGVVTFADTAGVDLAPTSDRAAVQRVVNGLTAKGDTSLYAAVQAAVTALGPHGDRSVVLLSDGADTTSAHPEKTLAALTGKLAEDGIRLDVVRFRTDDPQASAALSQLASAGRGAVVAAADAPAVGRAFRSAAQTLRSQARFEIKLATPLAAPGPLEITGSLAGQPFSVVQPLAPAAALASSPTAAAAPGPAVVASPAPAVATGWPSILVWLATGAVALALMLLAYGILSPDLSTRRERRLAALEGYLAPSRAASAAPGRRAPTPIAVQLVDLGERAMRGRRSTATTLSLINRADLPLRAGEWFVLRVVAGVVGLALGLVLAGELRLVGLAAGLLLGFALPQLVLRFLAHRRGAAFERVLPQSLLLVATSLRSGFGLPQALDSVARDSPEPVAKEFSRALAETRIGTDISDALERVATRMGSRAMEMAVMAIRIQREVGGNLAETLETAGRTLRERETLRGQVRALSAEGRLSAYILIALPIGIFLYMTMVNYDYVSLLWTTLPGVVMLVGGTVALVAGIFWMRKVVRIEV